MPIPVKEQQLNRLSAKEQIYRTLKEWIIDGTLKPGESLNDVEIAHYFNVSRTPVREAILLLSQQNLVDIVPSRGTKVSKADADVAFSIYEAISELSGCAARLACQKCTQKDLDTLKRLNHEFANVLKTGDYREVIPSDNAFHEEILAIAGNPYLKEFTEQLVSHAYRYESIYFAGGSDRSQSVSDHDKIIEALENHDERAAIQCAQDNWMGFYNLRLKPALSKSQN